MTIIEISKEEYGIINKTPFSAFEKGEFFELNKTKVDRIVYLTFNDAKTRFATCVGITGDTLKLPFSASFSMLSNITLRNKIICYHDAIKALEEWAQQQSIKKIIYSLPPIIYDCSTITMLINALFVSKYEIEAIEVNYEYYLSDFSDKYEMSIDPKARQKLRASLSNNLSFMRTDDLALVYNIIKQNRLYRGYPLWMSLDEIKKTMSIIDIDLFLVNTSDGIPIASAIIYKLTNDILRIVYWGSTHEYDHLRPMNFMAFNIFNYYKQTQYKIIDIGHSTDDSIPNFGLCDFKQSIGCKCSPKFVMKKSI